MKLNPSGVRQWSRQLGTGGAENGLGIAVGADSSIYAVGFTDGDLDGNTRAGSFDLFVVKYNAAGGKIWTRQRGTVSADFAKRVALDSEGGVFVGGDTSGGLDDNTSAGLHDGFVMKYNPAGNKQ